MRLRSRRLSLRVEPSRIALLGTFRRISLSNLFLRWAELGEKSTVQQLSISN